MDVSSVKAKTINDANASTKTKSTAEALMGNFSAAVAERMKMSGQGVVDGSNQSNLTGGVNIKQDIAPEQKSEPQNTDVAARDDAPVRDRAEPAQDNSDDYARPVDHKDDAPRDTMKHNDDRGEVSQNDQGNDAPEQGQDQSGDQQASSDDGQNDQAQSGSDGEAADTADAAADATVQQASEGQNEAALAGVVDMVNKNGQNKGAETQAAAAQSGDKVREAVANPNAGMAKTDGGEDAGDVDLANLAGQKKDNNGAGTQQTQANLGQRTENNHNLQNDPSLKQQQAADLSAKVGKDQNLEVKVEVTKQSEKLVSQPNAGANVQASVTKDGEGLNQTNTTAAAKPMAAGPQAANSHNLGNQAGGQQGDAQQQAQQQLQMAQAEAAKNAGNTDTKAQTSQAAQHNLASGAAKVGGAEGASSTQGLNQPTGTQQTQQAAQQAKTNAQPQAQARAQVTEQVNVQIQKAIAGGMDKINIQLKPAHLGRVDIQLEMASDGRVTAVVSADNKDTLDLLKQDSRELEKAMREAGLQMNSGDLSFNLRENGENAQGGQETAGSGSGMGPLSNEPTLEELLEQSANGSPQIISDDRVDITA
ncbi:flagellar hook-length control protein FliK [Magnetovibrio sp. PR-2]|uniref:flagellar hook-length control protein FliK n=1 Tax=Magnetovibrio sp. PR-2 TaxID=3120356 RepID=UPI002FCDFC2A